MGCAGGSNGLVQRRAKQAWLLVVRKFALYLQGMHAFAKWQRELVARPVFTREGATYVGLVPLDEQENASEEEPP